MTCAGAIQTFRLLDALVGWDVGADPDDAKGLTGLHAREGITLMPDDPGAIGADDLAPYLPPPWLAPGCGPCEWYLATPAGRRGKEALASRLLRLDGCSCDWKPVWAAHCTALPGANIAALAVSGHRIAVADRATAQIYLIASGGDRVIATMPVSDVAAMAFDPNDVLVVAQHDRDELLRFGPAGVALAPFAPAVPQQAKPVQRIGAGNDGSIWLAATGKNGGTYRLWRARFGDPAFVPARLSALAASRPATSLVNAGEDGFCIVRTSASATERCCYSRHGRPIDPGTIASSPSARYAQLGQLLTSPIDSGIPRCVWHRARIDADIPTGTVVSVAVATAEAADATPQGQSANKWSNFPAGVPHPLDWQEVSAPDFLIRQPPGRYLYLRLRLESRDGTATPRVRRIRLDFPRATSLDFLPAIYRQSPDAADFTERFLALFDASIADLDAAIERAPALLDAGGVPDDVLPWLARFLGLVLDPGWEPARRRRILRALPELYRRRGTLAGLKMAFRLVFDVEPAIEELSLERRWAAFDRRSHVGSVRLFGRKRARAQVGRSALGATVVKSYGDPALDPIEALAYRFRVLVPPLATARPLAPSRLQALVDSQKPAHTIASVRLGGDGFVLGTGSAVGIDTAFTPPPAPVLGRSGNVRLSRTTVLRRRAGAGRAGRGFAVGMQHLTE
jgi:phage tail-like protein